MNKLSLTDQLANGLLRLAQYTPFRDKAILDLGRGYGAWTLVYAHKIGANKLVAIEPFQSMAKNSREFAIILAAHNCDYKVCGHLDIPAEDGEFDAIISDDVMEHIHNPEFTQGKCGGC